MSHLSLDEDDNNPLSPAWSAEIKRRWAEYESGKVKAIPAEKMFRELDAEFGAKQ